MAIFMSKRRSKLSRKDETKQCCFCYSYLFKILYRIPFAVFLLILIFVWSSSATIISGNVVRVCVSSRKLSNLYCLSAGTEGNFEIPVPRNNFTNSNDDSNVKDFVNVFQDKTDPAIRTHVYNDAEDEAELAKKVVEDILHEHRSWRADKNVATCEGRGIYVYDLPTKFNKDLVGQCDDMMPWSNFCKFFNNDAFGEAIPELGQGWFNTHQYALELIFHKKVLKHPCRVYNENEAKLFYVPYYGGLDILRWHFKNISYDVKDSLSLELVKWLESKKSWIQHSGKDHVFVLGKISWDFRRVNTSWGTRLLELDQMQNPIKLLIERQPWHANDIGIPHPTYFHPRSDDDIVNWQHKVIRSQRKSLVSFAGGARLGHPENIRSILINQCTSSHSETCKFLNCSSGACDKPKPVIDLFMESEFCLQPSGDSPTRKSVFDSLISGCIPVLFDPFTAYYQYPWHLPEDHTKYSVFVDQEEVRKMKVNVIERLMKVSEKEKENMRRYIVYELLPGLVYGDLDSKLDKFQDAFSITMNNLVERVNTLV
ncbi:probable xyloglucan galactosyltransferase GT20 [Pistacia vera]|uniref:probable xyloglucan galactosyltransferase GT20 n=1 Tax=Pistacia vera TaxID=55513 RepID=UPI00126345CF|nr:probable xyloglucan galactosyltransferase GT20 [Pistacia vera]